MIKNIHFFEQFLPPKNPNPNYNHKKYSRNFKCYVIKIFVIRNIDCNQTKTPDLITKIYCIYIYQKRCNTFPKLLRINIETKLNSQFYQL